MDNNPYMRWINTYSSKEFSEATDRAIAKMDEIAKQATKSALSRMELAFEYCALLEWHFWDDAYDMTVFRNAYLTKESKASVNIF